MKVPPPDLFGEVVLWEHTEYSPTGQVLSYSYGTTPRATGQPVIVTYERDVDASGEPTGNGDLSNAMSATITWDSGGQTTIPTGASLVNIAKEVRQRRPVHEDRTTNPHFVGCTNELPQRVWEYLFNYFTSRVLV